MPFIGVQPASALLTSADIQDGQITTAKVADDAITGAKIENNPTIAGTLHASAGLTTPTGHVIQVARTYVSFSSHISTSSTSLVASGIQCSLTPKFSNSLILVDFSTTVSHSNSGDQLRGKMYVKVGSASISAMASADEYHLVYSPGGPHYQPTVFSGSYTASSTDTLMFEPYFRNRTQAVAIYLVHASASYSLTVTEIKQ